MSLNVGSLVAYLDLNDTNFDRKTKNANKQIDGLALHLKTLAQLDPELKIRTEATQAKLKALQDRLVELKAEAAKGADVRVDTAETMFKLAAVKAEIHALHREAGKSLEMNTVEAETKLARLAKSLDNVGGKLKGLKVPGGMLGTVAALGPTLIPAGNAAIGVLGGISVAAVEAAGSVGVLMLAFKGASGAATAYQAYQTAMMKATTAKQRTSAANTLNASAYGQAPAATQAFARFDVNQLKPFGQSLSGAAQAGVLPGLTMGLHSLIKDAPQIKGAISAIAHSLGSIFADAGKALQSPFWKQWIVFFGKDTAANVKTMGHTLGQLFEGVARAMERGSGGTHSLLGDIDSLATKFNRWTAGKGFSDWLASVKRDGHLVSVFLGNVWATLHPILQGLGGAGVTELSLLGGTFSLISHLPTTWLVAAGKYLPLIFLAAKAGGGSLNLLGTGLQALSKGMGAASGLLSKVGLGRIGALIGAESRLGGLAGKVSAVAATPVYVTNWPARFGGGGGTTGAAAGAAPVAGTIAEGAAATAVRGTLGVAGPVLMLGGDSAPGQQQGDRARAYTNLYGTFAKYHVSPTGSNAGDLKALAGVDPAAALNALRQFQKDSGKTWDQTVAYFAARPLLADMARKNSATDKAMAKLLNFGPAFAKSVPSKVTTKAELDQSPFAAGLVGLNLAKRAAGTSVVIPVSANTSQAMAAINSLKTVLQGGLGPVILGTPASRKGSKTKAFATGTNFAPGGWSWVGEQGPELINLPRGSRVIPHGRSEQMAAASMQASGGVSQVHLSDQSISRLAKAIVAHSSSTVLNELDFAGAY